MPSAARPEESSVVILGSWNPAILQPPWLAANVFEREAANTPVQVEFSMLPGQPPRFVMQGMRFVPSFDRLLVVPAGLEDEQLRDCESRVRRILDILPHTPISAFGVNFEFADNEPSQQLLGLFSNVEALAERADIAYETQETALKRAMRIGQLVLNFTRSLDSENVVTYKFNFHYAAVGAVVAGELLANALVNNFAIARRIVNVYDTLA